MKAIVKLGALTLLSTALIGCSTTEKPVEEEVVSQPVVEETVVEETAVGELVSFDRDAINDANGPLATKVIYFDYNSNDIRPEFIDVIANHGIYLSTYPDVKIRLEGHADERGSREYNVALGERRAQSVARLLKLQGATANQVSTISYGEEMPLANGHDEASWGKNRRVELVYEVQ